jgi:hypothetical protein
MRAPPKGMIDAHTESLSGAAEPAHRLTHEEKAMLQRSAALRPVTPYLASGRPKLCWGCGNPFVVRDGHAEAIVGPDGRMYCYANGCEDDVFAAHFVALKRAS